ncbi:MAG: MFS transporter [Ignavibacteriaceae bacterium]|nr:MFS transporter [Ignavibacteriaceae bacterium]
MKFSRIPRQVLLLGLVSLFTDMASEMLYPVTPIFLSGVLGASMAIIGLIEGLAEVTAGILKGYFGFLSDKLGKRSIFVVIGYSLSAISKPLPGLLPSTIVVLLSRVTDRIGKGVRTAPRDALLAGYSEGGNSGTIFGFHRGMDTMGAVIGPLIALMLLKIYSNNFGLIFLIAFIPSVAAIGVTLLIKDRKAEGKPRSGKLFPIGFWKEAPRDYKMLTILFTLFSLVNSSDVFLILRSKEISHSNSSAILVYVFYNLIYAGLSYPAGIFSDKFGKKNVLIAGLVIFSGVYFGFGLTSRIGLIWGLFFFYGVYAAFSEGILKAWVSDLVPDNKRGSAIGLITMLSGFAIMLGSLLTGVLWDKFGAQVPFILSGIVSLVVAVFLYILNRRVQAV